MVDTIYVWAPGGAACDDASRRADLLAHTPGSEGCRIVPVLEAPPASQARERSGEGRGLVMGTGAAMTVVGWQPRRWWPALHNARLARAILRKSGYPVLLVRRAPLQAYRNALFPSDFSGRSLEVLRRAMQALPRVRFTVLHAYRVPGQGAMQVAGVSEQASESCRRCAEQAARRAGERFVERAQPCGSRLSVLLAPRPPQCAIAAHEHLARPDLLVLGDGEGAWWDAWHGQPDVRTALGSTACDTLLIPAGLPGDLALSSKCAAQGARFAA